MKTLIASLIKGIVYLALAVVFTIGFSSCQKDDQYEKKEKAVLTVRVYNGLNPLGNMVSEYVVSNKDTDKWRSLYLEEKDGWGLEDGFEYSVLTWRLWYKQPMLMMDGPSFVYRFRKVLKKTKAEPLTTDDILWDIW